MSGYVYFLSNPAMPDLLKIGHTTDSPETRIRQLNTTGIPIPFVLEACFLVEAPLKLEQSIHAALAKYRPAQNREFFKVSSSQALELALPLILEATKQVKLQPQEGGKTNHDLGESEVHILQILASVCGQDGLNQYILKNQTEFSDLDIEIYLANLIAKKFASRYRDSRGYGYIWRATPKGVKFLSDNHLIEEWMRSNSW